MRRSIGVVTHTGLPVIDGKFFYNYIYSNKNMIINIVYTL